MEETDQRQLILKMQCGDVEAYEAIYRQYSSTVQRQLQGIVRNEEAASDLLQEVFLRVWTHSKQWNGHGSFRAWLLKLSTNLALNQLRTARRHPQLPFESSAEEVQEEEEQRQGNRYSARQLEEGSPGPAETFEKIETYLELRLLIDELPEEKREVFNLIHDAQLETREVAQRLGIPEGTVKSRLHYSNKILAQKWVGTAEEKGD